MWKQHVPFNAVGQLPRAWCYALWWPREAGEVADILLGHFTTAALAVEQAHRVFSEEERRTDTNQTF
jgi:hypothetical protein